MPQRAQPILVTLSPLEIPILSTGQDLGRAIAAALKEQDHEVHRGDVIAVASKIVSICQARIVKLTEVEISKEAAALARKWKLDKQLAQVVMDEADIIFGAVKGFVLTSKYGILTANAGVDLKNSPPGTATLWPTNPDRSARELRAYLERRCGCKIGVVIVDSRVTPMRLGTTGLAIGTSGFNPVRDERGKPDLYGREIRYTRTNVADDLAASAHLVMGESREGVGVVVISGAPLELTESVDGHGAKLKAEQCLIASILSSIALELKPKRKSQDNDRND